MQERAPWGIFLNEDALNKDVIERFSTLISQIMAAATDKTYIGDITVPVIPDGLRVLLHDTSRPMAFEKPEASETAAQRMEWEQKVNQQLKRWEVKVEITDEAKITGDMSANDLLKYDNGPIMGGDMFRISNGARAFSQAINAEGLAAMFGALTGTPATVPWAGATDAQVETDFENMIARCETEGYFPDKILWSRQARARIRRMLWVTGSAKNVPEYIGEFNTGAGPSLSDMIVTPIIYKDGNGDNYTMFTPVGSILMFQRDAFAGFAQRELTTEFFRDAYRGVDVALMRKFWLTVVAQTEAGQLLTTVGL